MADAEEAAQAEAEAEAQEEPQQEEAQEPPPAPLEAPPQPEAAAAPPASERDATRAFGKPRRRPRQSRLFGAGVPAAGSYQRSQFGKMVPSVNRSAPSFGFGTAQRFAQGRKANLPNFISKEHSKQLIPDYTPGPGHYVARSSLGSQSYSVKRSSATPAFIVADRFSFDSRERRQLVSVPAPNAYDLPGAIGTQVSSVKNSEAVVGFVGESRNAKNSMGKGFEGSLLARDTPGPGAYPLPLGYGVQVLAGNCTHPAPPFGREHRSVDPNYDTLIEKRAMGVPGPGAYSYDPACETQHSSVKPSQALYSFGKSVDRHRAGFASLDGERATKVFTGILGPGPQSEEFPDEPANGTQLLSQNPSKPQWSFDREMRLRPMKYTNLQAPGPGTYVV